MQYFVIAMILMVIISTALDMIHKKNVIYFFRNAKKAKSLQKTELSTGKKTAVILKTVAQDIATTSELGMGKKKISSCIRHVWHHLILDYLSIINFQIY